MRPPDHKRLHKIDRFDQIKFVTLPRYKMSELSGDEWRTSVVIEFHFKGSLIFEKVMRDMECALMYVGSLYLEAVSPVSDKYLKAEVRACDQPGCSNDFDNCFQLKRETASDGSWLEPEPGYTHYRKFCEKHSSRGDCDREDCDDNYVKIETPGELLNVRA